MTQMSKSFIERMQRVAAETIPKLLITDLLREIRMSLAESDLQLYSGWGSWLLHNERDNEPASDSFGRYLKTLQSRKV